jgi:class 3 adenylate cyclase/pimeloyl-ACP methyl ester carboxylesterase
MEPRIQYVKSKDGVRIACWTEGEGRPLLVLPTPQWARLGLAQLPERGAFWRRLAPGRRLVRYNARGTGQSDRDVADYSLEAQVADLEAVAGRFAGERFDLLAPGNNSAIAIAFAARHPERIEHLVLWHPWASGREYAESPPYTGFASLRSIAERNWDYYVSIVASTNLRGGSPELIRRAAQAMRDSVTPQDAVRILDALTHYDVTALLEQVQVPTLVLMRRHGAMVGPAAVQRVAAGIADAQLVVLEGDEDVYFLGDTEAVIRSIGEFLGEETAPPPWPDIASGMTAILFADIVDSTALTERLGDAAFRAKARDLDAALRTVIRDHAGTPIEGKLLGDGVLAVFTSARQAIDAALACARSGDDAGLPLHLGLHAGDVIREDNNVYGGAVNIASRISGLAVGEVLVSETVRSLARTSAGVRFEDRGEQALKGVGERVRVWAVVSESRSE